MTDEYNFTEQETDRQDRVDTAIAEMIKEVTPIGYFDWDMEIIGAIRDVIASYVVIQKRWMTEQQFYPYRVWDREGNIIMEPAPKKITVTAEQLCTAIEKVVNELDLDDLAKVAGDFLGGLCVWSDEDCNFVFVTDENYEGALD